MKKWQKIFCERTIKEISNNKKKLQKLKIGLMGLTFKENCNDIRNSQSFKIIDFFYKKKIKVQVIDPFIEKKIFKIKMYKKWL